MLRRAGTDKTDEEMIHEELSGKIIGAEMDVLNELRRLDIPAADYERAMPRNEKDDLPTKHTKHPKEEKPCFPFSVFSSVWWAEIASIQRLHDPESRIDQDHDPEHEQDAVIVDPKWRPVHRRARSSNGRYLNITGLDCPSA